MLLMKKKNIFSFIMIFIKEADLSEINIWGLQ